jgi:hypothetical protein
MLAKIDRPAKEVQTRDLVEKNMVCSWLGFVRDREKFPAAKPFLSQVGYSKVTVRPRLLGVPSQTV